MRRRRKQLLEAPAEDITTPRCAIFVKQKNRIICVGARNDQASAVVVHKSLQPSPADRIFCFVANNQPLAIMLHRFEAENPAQFDAIFKTASDTASQLEAPLFVHVTSSWCPDCVRADPAIHTAFEGRTKPAVVLTAKIPDSSGYRSPSFPYRTSPTLQLTAIPTVIRFGDGTSSRLVEDECYDQSKLMSLIHD